MASSSASEAPQKARLTGSTVVYMLKRSLAEFSRHGGTDQAAKLTYFMVLSIAPTLLALFSLATLLLSDVTDQIAEVIQSSIQRAFGGSSMDIEEPIQSTLDALMGSATGGTVALIIGVGTALWSASAYVKAYGRTSNTIYEVPEGRGPIRFTASMLLVTLGMILGMLAVLISLLLNQALVDGFLSRLFTSPDAMSRITFLTESFLPVWAWLKWPVILLILFVMVSLLYWAAPNVRRPFRLISPGGVVAIVGIAVAAVAVSIYMTTVASYSSYGAIGAIMAVLFALWIVNIVILIGAEVDSEFERARELEAGRPSERHLDQPLREEKGAKKKEEKYEKLVDQGRDIRLSNLHLDAESYLGEASRLTPTGGIPIVAADEAESAGAPDEPEAAGAPETDPSAAGHGRRARRSDDD